MKYQLVILILALTLLASAIPFTLASDYLPQKQNTDFNLVISSNNASACNLSYIQYPDGSQMITNLAMIKSGNTFYINITSGNYSQLGSICHGITCTDGVNTETGSVCREVTTAGMLQSTSQGISSAIYLILMIVLTFLFGGLGYRIMQSDKLKVLGIFFLVFGLFFVVYDVWLGYEYHVTLTGFPNSGIPETLFTMLIIILVAGLLVSLALLFTRWKQVFKWFKSQLRKKDTSEDEDVEDWDLSKFAGSRK